MPDHTGASATRAAPRQTVALAKRLFLLAIAVGLLLTAALAAVNVIRDYRARLAELDRTIAAIGTSYVPAIARGAFEFDTALLELLLDGIVLLRDIEHARVVESAGDTETVLAARGVPVDAGAVHHRYPLTVLYRGDPRSVGYLDVEADLADITAGVIERVGLLIASSALQVFAVAFFVLLLVQRAVVRHLHSIAAHVASTDQPTSAPQPLVLGRRHRDDELQSIVDAINDAHQRLAARFAEKDALVRELYHRTRNNMQRIVALLELRAARTADNPAVAQLVLDMRARVTAMALVHAELYESRDLSQISMSSYLPDVVRAMLRSHNAAGIDPVVETDDTSLLFDTAIPLGLIVAELVSNSVTHAFARGGRGTISVTLTRAHDGRVELRYRDDGVGVPATFDPYRDADVGLQTVLTLANDQLSGTILFNMDHGFGVELVFADDRYQRRI